VLLRNTLIALGLATLCLTALINVNTENIDGSGVVVSESTGRPVPDVRLTLSCWRSGLIHGVWLAGQSEVTSGADGKFRFPFRDTWYCKDVTADVDQRDYLHIGNRRTAEGPLVNATRSVPKQVVLRSAPGRMPGIPSPPWEGLGLVEARNAGARAAQADASVGNLTITSVGLPADQTWNSAQGNVLARYGIARHDYEIYGDRLVEEREAYLQGYDSVMVPAIEAKHGREIWERLRSETQALLPSSPAVSKGLVP
jgi:hypothetical protein